jgi:hypothetical protein
MKRLNRSHVAIFFIGILVAVFSHFGLDLLREGGQAQAAVSAKECDKPYTPRFEEWVTFYLQQFCTAHRARSSGKLLYSASIDTVQTERGGTNWKWIFQYSPAYKQYVTTVVVPIRKIWMGKQVEEWRRRGYNIEITDFTFELKPFPS